MFLHGVNIKFSICASWICLHLWRHRFACRLVWNISFRTFCNFLDFGALSYRWIAKKKDQSNVYHQFRLQQRKSLLLNFRYFAATCSHRSDECCHCNADAIFDDELIPQKLKYLFQVFSLYLVYLWDIILKIYYKIDMQSKCYININQKDGLLVQGWCSKSVDQRGPFMRLRRNKINQLKRC